MPTKNWEVGGNDVSDAGVACSNVREWGRNIPYGGLGKGCIALWGVDGDVETAR